MKITEISIEQKKQIRQYEPVTLGLTASVGENDNAEKIIDNLKFFVEYKLNEDTRNAKLAEIEKDLEDPDIKPEAKTAREAWIQKYKDERAEFEALEFVNG